jgi:hypothetical protein
LVPKIAEAVKATIELSVKDEEKGLDYESMKNYLRFVALVVRLHKKVAPETVDVSYDFYFFLQYIFILIYFFFIAEKGVGYRAHLIRVKQRQVCQACHCSIM